MQDNKKITKLSANGQDIFVISDLHVGAGKRTDGCFAGTENFFFDAAFQRWLTDMSDRKSSSKPAILLINGDFIDFLRINEIPQTEADFMAWSRLLATLDVTKSVEELKASVSKKEQKFGLKTNDYKSVWKLRLVADGHSELFTSLGKWLSEGNQLWIVKGNHDLEWHWALVRQCLRDQLYSAASLVATSTQQEEQIRFFEDSLLIDGQIYVEHGHRYDTYSHVRGKPILEDGQELNIPFGSFLNRYLLNQIELDYPFLDNIRPTVNILPILIRERFSLAIKLLFYHVPFVLLIIPKKYYAYVLRRFLAVLIALSVPVGIGIWQVYRQLSANNGSWLLVSQSVVWLIVAYLLARLAGGLLLAESDSLLPEAQEIFQANNEIRLVTFGHTHIPAQTRPKTNLFLNTGTWIPIIENSSAALRLDRTFTFLHIPMYPTINWEALKLERWNDDALRAEPMILINKR